MHKYLLHCHLQIFIQGRVLSTGYFLVVICGNLCQLPMGHSTPNGAKFLRLGNDPSQNLTKICQVVTIYKI